MRGPSSLRRAAGAFLLGLCAACTGNGSDIGPKIVRPTGTFSEVLVRDDQGVAVVNARVEAGGSVGVTDAFGRAELPGAVTGVQRIDVTATDAAGGTTALDLVGYSIELDFGQALEPTEALHLASLDASSGAALVPGAQPGAVTLDDSAAPSGAVVALPSGAAVSGLDAPATLRSGALPPHLVPGVIPAPSGATVLPGRAVQLAPRGLSFAPAATLAVPNDFGLVAGSPVSVWRLDDASGRWLEVGTGTVDGGGTRVSSTGGVVDRTGLYCFVAAAASVPLTLTGRVLDGSELPRSRVLVRTANARARTDPDGRFTLTGIASADGAGAPRTLDVVLTGGLGLRPLSTTTEFTTTPGVGSGAFADDLELEVREVGRFRGLLVFRGNEVPFQWLGLSNASLPAASFGITDGAGRVDLLGVESGVTSLQTVLIDANDPTAAYSTEATINFPPGARTFDVRTFLSRVPSIDRPFGGAFTYLVDSRGGGTVFDAVYLRRFVPGAPLELIGPSPIAGGILIEYGVDGTAVGAVESTAPGGRNRISVFSLQRPQTGRIELPLDRPAQPEPAAFDRFVAVRGGLRGADPADTSRRLVASPVLLRRTWFDQVARGLGEPFAGPAPVLEGGTPPDRFVAAAPRSGRLAVAVGPSADRVRALGAGVVFAAPTATSVGLDLQVSVPVDEVRTVAGALQGLDPAIGLGGLTMDYALLEPGSFVTEVGRDVAGNVGGASELSLTLARPGPLAAAGYVGELAWVRGSAGAVEQGQLLEFGADGSVRNRRVGFVPAPVVTEPASGQGVSAAAGVTVTWQPLDVDAVEVRVRTRDPMQPVQRSWTALVPGDVTTFSFGPMPDGAPDPLDPDAQGGAYEVEVVGLRVGRDPFFSLDQRYLWISSRRFGYRDDDLGISAVSSTTVDFTLLP